MTKQILSSQLRTILLAFGALSIASADVLDFTCITNNTGSCQANIAPNFQATVTDGGAGTVNFLFTNTDPVGVISQIYFDQGTTANWFGSISITALSGTQVGFHSGANPANLPAGNTVAFTADFSAGANSGPGGVIANSVAAGETITLTGTLLTGLTFGDFIAGLSTTATDPSGFRVGIHAQNYGGGLSEALVGVPGRESEPPPAIPEPSTYLLMGSALAGLGLLRRRSNNR